MTIRVTADSTSFATATNGDCVVTIPAQSYGKSHLAYITWSYSAAPTAGRLTIASNGVTIFDVDITGAGVGALRPVPLPSAAQASIVITLAAGGAANVGKLNAYAGKY